jgi:hypothetical protein
VIRKGINPETGKVLYTEHIRHIPSTCPPPGFCCEFLCDETDSTCPIDGWFWFESASGAEGVFYHICVRFTLIRDALPDENGDYTWRGNVDGVSGCLSPSTFEVTFECQTLDGVDECGVNTRFVVRVGPDQGQVFNVSCCCEIGTDDCHGSMGFYGFTTPSGTGIVPVFPDSMCPDEPWNGATTPQYGIILERKNCEGEQCEYNPIFPPICGQDEVEENLQLQALWEVKKLLVTPAVTENLQLTDIYDCSLLIGTGGTTWEDNLRLADLYDCRTVFANCFYDVNLQLGDIWDAQFQVFGQEVYTDNLVLGDIWDVRCVLFRDITDNLALGDSWECRFERPADYDANLALGDLWDCTQIFANCRFEENLSLQDFWATIREDEEQFIPDRMLLDDIWELTCILNTNSSDPLRLADAWDCTRALPDSLTHNLQLGDEWDCRTVFAAQPISEDLVLGDSWDCQTIFPVDWDENLELADAWDCRFDLVRTYTANLSLGDEWDCTQIFANCRFEENIGLQDFWQFTTEDEEDFIPRRMLLDDQWELRCIFRPKFTPETQLGDVWDCRLVERIDVALTDQQLRFIDFFEVDCIFQQALSENLQLQAIFSCITAFDAAASENLVLASEFDCLTNFAVAFSEELSLGSEFRCRVRYMVDYTANLELFDLFQGSLEDMEDLQLQNLNLQDAFDCTIFFQPNVLLNLQLGDVFDANVSQRVGASLEENLQLAAELIGQAFTPPDFVDAQWLENVEFVDNFDEDLIPANCCDFTWCAEPYIPQCVQCSEEPSELEWRFEGGAGSGDPCCFDLFNIWSEPTACTISRTFNCGGGGANRLTFNGNDYIEIAAIATDPQNQDERWSLMANAVDINQLGELITTLNNSRYIRSNTTTNSWRMSYGNSGVNFSNPAGLPLSGQDFKLEAIWRSNGVMEFRFNDGVWNDNAGNPITVGPQTSTTRIGGRPTNGFVGQIWDVKRLNPVTGATLNHWPMDEGSGTTVADIVGGLDGTVVGATWSGNPVDLSVDVDLLPTGPFCTLAYDDGSIRYEYYYQVAGGLPAPYDCTERIELVYAGGNPGASFHPNDPCGGAGGSVLPWAMKFVLNPQGNVPAPDGPGTPTTVEARVSPPDNSSVCCEAISFNDALLTCYPNSPNRIAGACWWESDWIGCGDLAYQWWGAVFAGSIQLFLNVQQQVSAPIPYWLMRWTLSIGDANTQKNCDGSYELVPLGGYPQAGQCPPGNDCTGNEGQWPQNDPCPEVDWSTTKALWNPLGFPLDLEDMILQLGDNFIGNVDPAPEVCAGCTNCSGAQPQFTSCDLCPPPGGGGFGNTYCLGSLSATIECSQSTSCRWSNTQTIVVLGINYLREIIVTVSGSQITASHRYTDILDPDTEGPWVITWTKAITAPIDCTDEHLLGNAQTSGGAENNPCTGGAWTGTTFRWNPASSCI